MKKRLNLGDTPIEAGACIENKLVKSYICDLSGNILRIALPKEDANKVALEYKQDVVVIQQRLTLKITRTFSRIDFS